MDARQIDIRILVEHRYIARACEYKEEVARGGYVFG